MWFSQPAEGEQELEMPLLAPTKKKKTCPTCRTEVHSRPVVAYLIKSALQTVLPCLDPSTYDKVAPPSSTTPDDPWKGIFPDELGPNAARHRDNIREAHPEVIIDEEDGGVPRCPVCLHEIFDGVCSGCSRLYDGVSDDDDNDDINSNDGGRFWQRLYLSETAVAENPPAWIYTDDDHSEDNEPYESSFIDDDGDANPALGRSSEVHLDNTHSPVRPTRRSRTVRGARHIPSDEEHAPSPNPEHWQSYLTRAARRHGNVETRSAPIVADLRDSEDDSDGSDWVPRPRHQRLAEIAREARQRNRQRSLITSDEDDSSDHGRMPSYLSVSNDEDIIVPPYAPRRGVRRRVVNVGTSEDEDSEEDVFEDAVSTEGRTATSAGRQSSRYYAGTSHDGQSDSEEAHGASPIVHRRPIPDDDDGDDASRHWASDQDIDSSSHVHGSAHYYSSDESDSDVASDEQSDSSL